MRNVLLLVTFFALAQFPATPAAARAGTVPSLATSNVVTQPAPPPAPLRKPKPLKPKH